MDRIISFLWSPTGIGVVCAVIATVLAIVVKRVPRVGQLYETHKGTLFDAVKAAERAIPDDTQNTGLRRLDAALKYLVQAAPELAKAKPHVLSELVNKAHAEAEERGKL